MKTYWLDSRHCKLAVVIQSDMFFCYIFLSGVFFFNLSFASLFYCAWSRMKLICTYKTSPRLNSLKKSRLIPRCGTGGFFCLDFSFFSFFGGSLLDWCWERVERSSYFKVDKCHILCVWRCEEAEKARPSNRSFFFDNRTDILEGRWEGGRDKNRKVDTILWYMRDIY